MAHFITAFISGLSAKEKKILYIALGVVVLALFDRLVVSPITHEAARLDEEIASQTTVIGKNLLLLQYTGKILSENKSFAPYYTDGQLTQEELIALFLREIETLAKNASIILTNINPVEVAEEVEGLDYSFFTLTVECAGTMQNMLDFFYSIDKAVKPIRVLTFDLSAKNRENYEVKAIVTVQKLIVTDVDDTMDLPTVTLPVTADAASDTQIVERIKITAPATLGNETP